MTLIESKLSMRRMRSADVQRRPLPRGEELLGRSRSERDGRGVPPGTLRQRAVHGQLRVRKTRTLDTVLPLI